MDLHGPYPTGDYLLTLIDYRSRYPAVIPMRTITAEKVIKELRTVFGYFGLPETLTTDNDPQFISIDFLWYLSNNEIHHRRVTPKWAKANGKAERFRRALLKANQAAFVEGKDWRRELDDFLLAYRTTPHTVTGEVPADVFFGRSIRTKIPSFKEFREKQHGMKEMKKRDHERKEKIKKNADQRIKAAPSDIAVEDKVLLRREKYMHKLSSRWQNKIFTVVNRYGNSVVIQDFLGRRYTRNVSCVEKYFARSEVNPQVKSDSENDVDYVPFSN